MRDPANVDVADPIAVVAQCLVDKTLWSMLRNESWRALIPVAPRTPAEFFQRFGDAYGIPEAHHHAAALRNATEEGAAALDDEYMRSDELYGAKVLEDQRSRSRSRAVWSTVFGVGILASLLWDLFIIAAAYGHVGQ